MRANDDFEWVTELLGIGSVGQLNDCPCDVSRKKPLGFPIPQGDDVTPYRERLKKGAYQEKAAAKTPPAPKRKVTKRSTTRPA